MGNFLFSSFHAFLSKWRGACLTGIAFMAIGLGTVQAQSPCDPVLAISCAANQVVYCGDLAGFVPPSPVAEVVGCPDFVIWSVNFEFTLTPLTSGSCQSTYAVNWLVDVEGNVGGIPLDLSGTCSHVLTAIDNEGPVFASVPASATMECSSPMPGSALLTATDECGVVEQITVFTSTTSGGAGLNASYSFCQLTTPLGPGPDGSIWLNGVQALGLAASNYWSWTGSPVLQEYPDGTAQLTGTVVNNANPTQGWQVEMWFQNRRNWSQWSALGRSYKDDLNLATPGSLFTGWEFYELVPTFSRLTGFNAYAGNELYLSHQPANYYYGFQLGQAANSRNASNGMSGWFFWEGWFNGQWRSGNGDLFTNTNCADLEVDCETETTYLWRAEDACGNNTFASQTITMVDTTGPVFDNCPANVTIECGTDLPAVPVVTATDACSATIITYLGQSSINYTNPCEGTLTRTWAADDECGNRTFCVQTITIVDSTAPVFSFTPADATYECNEDIIIETPTAIDACLGPVDVVVTEETIAGSCPQEYTIMRTFTATDNCSNVNTVEQIITVNDTTAPVFNPFPVTLSVECTEVDAVPALTAADNCGSVTVELESEVLGSGGCLGVLQRHYVATDECGNSSEAFQYITILDNTPPVIDNPDDFTVECSSVPALPTIPITDNCGDDVTIETSTQIISGDCPNSYSIVWTWTVTDLCDNVSTASTTVTVVDTTNPVFDFLPANETYECDETIPAPTIPGATDNCDTDVTVSFTETV
ncbi:MAG: hypothetical protein ACK5XV_02940, partial [Flavobacteriales bacterium]